MKKLFVILTAIAMVGAFTATAMAADWSFYGSQRFETFYNMLDRGDLAPAGTSDDDADLSWSQQGNSRFGASAAAGNVTGAVEYGNSGGNANIRLLWGQIDFGGWTMGLGQHYTPVHAWVSSQRYAGDAGLLDLGGIYGGRKDMIQFGFMSGALKVALVEPSTAGVPAGADTDTIIPKLEASYMLPLGDSHSLKFLGGYNLVNMEDAAGNESGSISSYIAGIAGFHNFGALYFNWDAYVAQNSENYGLGVDWVSANRQNSAVVDPVTLKVTDSAEYGALLAFGMAFSDTMSFEVGGGYISADNDSADDPDDTMAFYVNLPIKVGEGTQIIPEIGTYIDGEDGNGNDGATLTYAGAQWRISF